MKKKIRAEYILLLAIVFLAVIFRIYKLRTAPDWYLDEGEFIRLANYLSRGNFDFLGIRNSMLLIGRPPLFLWVLAGIFKIFGTDIVVLRSLTVLCSIAIMIICYFFARQSLGRIAAFYAVLLLAIMPEYVFYNRMGFTYNWTSLWMILSTFALWSYLKEHSQRWLVVACISAGIAFASDYLGIISILIIIGVLAIYRPSDLWKVFITTIPILLALLPTFIIAPGDAWHDLVYSLSSVTGGNGILGSQFAGMLVVYPEMVQRQPMIILGIIGLFILPDKRLRGLLLTELIGIFILFSLSRTLAGHYLLPVWPLVLVGLGYFLEKAVDYFYVNVKSSLSNLICTLDSKINDKLRNLLGSNGSTLLVFCFVFLPISWMIMINIKGYMVEPMDPSIVMTQVGWLFQYDAPDDAQAIAKEINQNVKPGDFVIASGAVSWMLQSNAADPRTVYIYEYGGKRLGLRDFNHDRFTVNSSLSNAKYVVVDNTWRFWLFNLIPEIATMFEEVSKWPLVMERGSLQLYCNPTYCH